MKKLILVIIDGLNDQTAEKKFGFMKHLEEQGLARKTVIRAALPTLSRPLYETILTGKEPYDHGIVHNLVVRRSKETSIFHRAAQAGLVTAAAAYYWISELYMQAPFQFGRDRFQLAKQPPIHYGIYYSEDAYPDSHLFQDAQYLVELARPDFLLVHPMNLDYLGHLYGGESVEYGQGARKTDFLLSAVLPGWMEAGYQVIVTADHGMGADRQHGGPAPEERLVPLWYVKADREEAFPPLPEEQIQIFPLLLDQLGLGAQPTQE